MARNQIEVGDYSFGPEAGPANTSYTHVQPVVERRSAAAGPASAGDIRSTRGAGPLAVLSQAPVGEGLTATAGGGGGGGGAAAAAAVPGGTGDLGSAPASSPVVTGGTGIHFVGATPIPGLVSSQAPTGAPAGFAGTSGPGLVGGSNTIGVGGHNPFGLGGPNPNAVIAKAPGGLGAVGRI